MDLHELDVRINTAGQLPSAINTAAERLIAGGKISAMDLGPILAPLGDLRDALIDIQRWSTDAQRVAPPVDPAPAGGDMWSMYVGPRDVATMTADDMRFVITTSSGGTFAHNLWFGLISGNVKDAWQAAAQGSGLSHFNQAGYIAANGDLVQAYRAAGGAV